MRVRFEKRVEVLAGVRNRVRDLSLPSSSSNLYNYRSSQNNGHSNNNNNNDNNNNDNDNDNSHSSKHSAYLRSDITLNDVANKMKPLYPRVSTTHRHNNATAAPATQSQNKKKILKHQSTYDISVYSASYTCEEVKEESSVAVLVTIQVKNISL